jgi:hypothetical protein
MFLAVAQVRVKVPLSCLDGIQKKCIFGIHACKDTLFPSLPSTSPALFRQHRPNCLWQGVLEEVAFKAFEGYVQAP